MPKNQIYVSGDIEKGTVFITSGFQPPTTTGTFREQLEVHSEMQSYASGGAIFHINLEQKFDINNINKFIKKIFENYPIRYISLTPILSICNNCKRKYIGKINICKECSSKDVSIWARPVGYFRPAIRGDIAEDYEDAAYKFWAEHKIKELSNMITIKNENEIKL